MNQLANKIKSLLTKKIILGTLSFIGIPTIITIFILAIVILTIVGLNDEEDSKNDGVNVEVGEKGLSPHVKKYKDKVTKYAKKNDVEDYVPYILGMMEQESGGNPDENDPMQSSESKCGSIGCITDPDESIKQGVKYFSETLKDANNDPILAVASYNMGGGFISYYQDKKGKDKDMKLDKEINDKKTSKELISFSQKEYKKNPDMYDCSRSEGADLDACHGDIMYVDSVLDHVDDEKESDSDSKDDKVDVKGDKAFPVTTTKNITSEFDPEREHPKTGEVQPHNGMDISDEGVEGDKIVSFMDGEVTVSKMSDTAGNLVHIEHKDGLTTVYMHMSDRNVKSGQEVKAGDKIGEVGTTGDSTGPHLHFETRVDGNAVNPKKFTKDL